jgi:hypothetical protein
MSKIQYVKARILCLLMAKTVVDRRLIATDRAHETSLGPKVPANKITSARAAKLEPNG